MLEVAIVTGKRFLALEACLATKPATRYAIDFPVPTSASLIETRPVLKPSYMLWASFICSSRTAYP